MLTPRLEASDLLERSDSYVRDLGSDVPPVETGLGQLCALLLGDVDMAHFGLEDLTLSSQLSAAWTASFVDGATETEALVGGVGVTIGWWPADLPSLSLQLGVNGLGRGEKTGTVRARPQGGF